MSMQGQFLIQFLICRNVPVVCFRSELICKVIPSLMSFSAQREVIRMCWLFSLHHSEVVVIPVCFALSPFVKSNCSLQHYGSCEKTQRVAWSWSVSSWFWLAKTLWMQMTFICFLFISFTFLEWWAQRQAMAKEVLILSFVLVYRNGFCAVAYSSGRSAS